MSKSVVSLILQAVDEKRQDALNTLRAAELTAHSADTSWSVRQELGHASYDAEQHKRTKAGYQRQIDAANELVKEWQQAYDYVLQHL